MTDLRKELENLVDIGDPYSTRMDIYTAAKLALRAAIERGQDVALSFIAESEKEGHSAQVVVDHIQSLLDSLEVGEE